MNRRKFLIAGGLGLAVNLCGGLTRIMQPTATVRRADPTGTTPPVSTSTRQAAATGPAAPATAASPAAVEQGTPQAAGNADLAEVSIDLVDESFDDAQGLLTRVIRTDSADQISFSPGLLQIRGEAPGDNDPSIYTNQRISGAHRQVIGTRFKVEFGQESGRTGLISTEGLPLASIRRTAREGAGGVIECGGQSFPVLNLYSGCWYDFAAFLRPESAENAGGNTQAFAVNDGAGLELVLMTANPGPADGYVGYQAAAGAEQGASIDAWYALGLPAFPPAILSQAAPPAGYEADAGTNAAWVEARIRWVDGEVGLRIRSVDAQNEYRVTLDGRQLKVDQVIEGTVTPVASQAVEAVDGAKLAVRYNELTLTVYYNGQATRIVNQKIGAGALIAGTKVGVYSTSPGNELNQFFAWAVNLGVPESLAGRLLDARQVLCLGDSLTSADLAYGYQNRLRKRLGDRWVTVDGGVPGQTTWQMLTRLPSHLQRYHPEVLVVLGGTNDIDNHHNAASIQANLQAIYSMAKQDGLRVATVSIPPFGSAKSWTREKQAVLEQVNDWIQGRSGSPANVDYQIDAYALLEEPGTGCLQQRYDGGDHIHMNMVGFNALADAIFHTIDW